MTDLHKWSFTFVCIEIFCQATHVYTWSYSINNDSNTWRADCRMAAIRPDTVDQQDEQIRQWSQHDSLIRLPSMCSSKNNESSWQSRLLKLDCFSSDHFDCIIPVHWFTWVCVSSIKLTPFISVNSYWLILTSSMNGSINWGVDATYNLAITVIVTVQNVEAKFSLETQINNCYSLKYCYTSCQMSPHVQLMSLVLNT